MVAPAVLEDSRTDAEPTKLPPSGEKEGGIAEDALAAAAAADDDDDDDDEHLNSLVRAQEALLGVSLSSNLGCSAAGAAGAASFKIF